MVGRNDPCLCGSGKKYKKCCALKNEASNDGLLDEELEQVIMNYVEKVIENPTHFSELERYQQEWIQKLGAKMSEEEIEQAVMEYYLFIARRDLWKRHLMKILNGPVHSATREVLEAWQNPFVLFAEVIDNREGYLHVEEVLGDQIYCLELEEGMLEEGHEIVFGIVLPDNRHRSNGIRVLEGLTFIRNQNDAFTEKVKRMAEESGVTTSHDFFKAYMVDLYETIVGLETDNIEDFAEQNLTEQQQEVLEVLELEMLMLDLHFESEQFIQMIAITYLLKEQPKFRKPQVIAAALFKTAQDVGALDDYSFSQAEIAERFDVSTGSMMQHADRLIDFVYELMERMEAETNDGPVFSYDIGTDPRMTERVTWEMHCKSGDREFGAVEELQAFMHETMNEPFNPDDQAQQAQLIAYDAYEAEGNKERYRLAKKAYALDPKNVDALLLQAEMAKTEESAEHCYQAAIQSGKIQFDDEPEIPWALVTNRPYMRAIFAYGIWLYENGRFGEAASQFEELLEMNPEDHQGARYLAVSSFIYNDEYFRASNILEEVEEWSSDEAPYLYLLWVIEMDRSEGEAAILPMGLFTAAEEENPFVSVFLEEDMPKLPYPRKLSVTPGSIEEARYIHYLL